MINEKVNLINQLRLTNRDISERFRDYKFILMPSDFIGAFAYYAACQNHNPLVEVDRALNAFKGLVLSKFDKEGIPQWFTYDQLEEVVNEEVFESIPEIMELNTMKPDFIDLDALARNIFFMIARNNIVDQSSY